MVHDVSVARCVHQAGAQSVSMMAAASIMLVASFLPRVSAAPDVQAYERAGGGRGWLLQGHSFERTLTYDDNLKDWVTSAATMPLRDRVQLLPPVPDRHALMWHKKAIQSSNFEITFIYRAVPYENKDGMFAFWIGADNFTSNYDEQAIIKVRNWTEGLAAQGFSFYGNRPTFKGLGVIFLGADRQGQLRPSVSGVLCDGKKSLAEAEFPALEDMQSGPSQTKYVDWRQAGVEMKVFFTKDAIVGSLKASDGSDWVQLFSLPAEAVARDMTDAYVGFSGYSGSTSNLELDLSRLETRNFDAQHMGEDEKGALEEDTEEWIKVLMEEKRYIDQKSQKDAVEKLTKLLSDHVERYNKAGEQVKSDLLRMEKRVVDLESNITGFMNALQAYNPVTGKMEAASVKDHIADIRSILTKHTDVHDAKFAEVNSVARELKVKGVDVLGVDGRAKVVSVANQAHDLEKHASSSTLRTNGMLIMLILAVAVLGLLFLNRMRYYEKKHYI